MKTRALGFLLMVAAAGVYAVGCGSSGNNNGAGGSGAGGKATGGSGAGGMGAGGKATGGSGMGGAAGAGMGGKDGGTDAGTGGKDASADMSTDVPMDGNTGPTFTDVYAILSNITTPTADTAPGCLHCHDGIIPDGGMQTLPHVMNFSTKAAAYAALVGVDSLRCGATDAGAALKRVLAGNAAQSVLWQKLNFGLNPSMPACAGRAMPLNLPNPADAGPDGGDAGPVDAGFQTHYAITSAQLATVMGWINAGALNN